VDAAHREPQAASNGRLEWHPPRVVEEPRRRWRVDVGDLPFRAAPHNLEAEQALLGAILVNNDALDRVSGFIEPQHFFPPLHGAIFEAAAKLIAAGKRADPITLKPFFAGAEPVGDVPVPIYLGQIAANATTIINVREYASVVRDLWVRRQLILIGEDVVNAAYDSRIDFPAKEQIEEAETRLYSLAEHGHSARSEVTRQKSVPRSAS
jgi:replicative DNA helicase